MAISRASRATSSPVQWISAHTFRGTVLHQPGSRKRSEKRGAASSEWPKKPQNDVQIAATSNGKNHQQQHTLNINNRNHKNQHADSTSPSISLSLGGMVLWRDNLCQSTANLRFKPEIPYDMATVWVKTLVPLYLHQNIRCSMFIFPNVL